VSQGSDASELEPLFTTTYAELPSSDFFPGRTLDLWTESLWRANELANLYTDARVLQLLEEFDTSTRASGEQEESRLACLIWLEKKRRQSVLARAADEVFQLGTEDSLAALRETILTVEPTLSPVVELVDLAAQGYPEFLRGEQSGHTLLFGSDSVSLWERYFDRGNPLYQPTNAVAAYAASVALERSGVGEGGPRVLEVGAGCGSGSQTLLDELFDTGGGVGSLTLTDISPNFLRKARERVEASHGDRGVEFAYRMLDLNADAERWKLDAASCDLVFGVNVLHTVRDLVGTLRGLRESLAEGGHVVIGECVRPSSGRPVHPEFVFQMLDEFHDVQLEEGFREQGGFLDVAGWRKAFEVTGYSEVEIIPDFERIAAEYEEFSIGAVVAKR